MPTLPADLDATVPAPTAADAARFRAIVEAQDELVSLAQADGTLVYVNPAYAQHFARAPAQMLGTNLFSLIAPADRAAVEDQLDEVLRSGATRSGENRTVAPDGTEKWVAWTNRPLRDGGGLLLHSVGRDVTDRRRTEQALLDSQLFLRTITDGLPVRIAYVDRERRYRFVNRAHCERFGRSRDEIIGRTRSELTGVGDGLLIDTHIDAALAGTPQRFEYDETWQDAPRRIESQLIPHVDADGRVQGFFSIGVDTTERSHSERALRELTEIIEHTTDYVVQADWRGNLVYMNPAARRAVGIAPGEAIGLRSFSEFYPSQTQAQFADTIVPAVRADGVWLGASNVCVQGGEIPVSHMVIAHRDASARVSRYSAVMRDTSDEVRAKEAAQRQTDILRLVTDAVPTTVVVVGADARYQFANGAFERYVGLPRERIIGRTAIEVLGEGEVERRRPYMKRALGGETVQFTLDYPSADGTRHLALTCIPLKLRGGEVDAFVGISEDVTHEMRERARLTELANTDALTGLLNRAGFEQAIALHVGDGGGDSLALLYVDLDHFKPVNDRHGHAVGDQVLRQFAQRLRATVRPSDAVARIGGDEFAILLGGLRELAHARGVAEKIVVVAAVDFEIDGRVVRIGASVGVAFGFDPAQGWRAVIERADGMLYQAKAAGRGRVAAPPA